MRIEFDSLAFAKQWNPGWKISSGGGLGVVFFLVPARADVDRVFARMSEAGYGAQKSPEDAFWGARYAILEDPDANAVGIMSPTDPAQRSYPAQADPLNSYKPVSMRNILRFIDLGKAALTDQSDDSIVLGEQEITG